MSTSNDNRHPPCIQMRGVITEQTADIALQALVRWHTAVCDQISKLSPLDFGNPARRPLTSLGRTREELELAMLEIKQEFKR